MINIHHHLSPKISQFITRRKGNLASTLRYLTYWLLFHLLNNSCKINVNKKATVLLSTLCYAGRILVFAGKHLNQDNHFAFILKLILLGELFISISIGYRRMTRLPQKLFHFWFIHWLVNVRHRFHLRTTSNYKSNLVSN